ncbi:hypothetical protein [Streptodolium elevatio]
MTQHETIDAVAAHHALHSEAAFRQGSAGPELRLPEKFEMPHESWPAGYAAEAANVAGLRGCGTWDEAFPHADAFLTSLLGPAFTGTWHPDRETWQTDGAT